MTRQIVAILRGIHPPEVKAVGDALVAAGITRIEVPLNAPDAMESICTLVRQVGSRALVGAGTVLTSGQVAEVAAVGGRLIVSPDCNPEVIAATKAAGMVSCPGVMTPTECLAAVRAGADMLKLFPATMIGPDGLKVIRPVLPKGTTVLAVGGAGPDNFAAWREASADGFGIATALYRPGDSTATVADKAARVVAAYDAVYS